VCAVLATAILCVVVASGASAANSSEQVVFSKTGAFSTTLGPLGFWVWCEAESANPYVRACSGSLYFYFFGVPRGVHGSIVESPADSGLYTMTLSSADGFISNCHLRNPNGAVSGPMNAVNLGACTVSGAPAHPGDETVTTTAVVKVTGP